MLFALTMSKPLIRVFIKDSNLVSYLITNGIDIGHCRYRVEESKNSGRPFPCRIYLLYHNNKLCSKKPSCYKCGKEPLSYTCNQQPNRNYCGTCKLIGHPTAAASYPLRPTQNYNITPDSIYQATPKHRK